MWHKSALCSTERLQCMGKKMYVCGGPGCHTWGGAWIKGRGLSPEGASTECLSPTPTHVLFPSLQHGLDAGAALLLQSAFFSGKTCAFCLGKPLPKPPSSLSFSLMSFTDPDPINQPGTGLVCSHSSKIKGSRIEIELRETSGTRDLHTCCVLLSILAE